MNKRNQSLSLMLLFVASLPAAAQIVIAAGTPEDQALQTIAKEESPDKKLPMYQDFVQKFSSNPAAVAYGDWQISQYYQGNEQLPQALEYGDKALAASPENLDILVSQVNIAQQLKDDGKIVDYATRGGTAYQKLPQPAPGVENTAKGSYEFMESTAYNAIVDTTDPRTRMDLIEKFTPAFPNSRFQEGITSYAMMSLSALNDMPRLVAFGQKTLATSPENLPALLLMANSYAEDPKPGSLAKSVSYAQKAIAVAKADEPDADKSRKMSAGVAHSTLGYVYLKQDKTVQAIPELKTATSLLKGQDEQSYAMALYRLGFAYAKLNHVSEARDALTQAVKIQGPVQQLSQQLLVKVNAARAKGQ